MHVCMYVCVRVCVYTCTRVCVCVCVRVVSAAFAQRVGVPNLSWRPSALSISHCLGESYLELQLRYNTATLHTHTHSYTPTPRVPTTTLQRQKKRQTVERWQGTDAWTTFGEDVMKEMKWDSRHKASKKQQKEQRGWSQTPTEEPRLPALPYWLPSSPAFRPPLALFSSLLFDMLCLCPSLTQLNPVFCPCLLLALGSPLSSTPRPVPRTLQFFLSPSPLKLSP